MKFKLIRLMRYTESVIVNVESFEEAVILIDDENTEFTSDNNDYLWDTKIKGMNDRAPEGDTL